MRKNVIMPAVCEICPERHALAKVANLTKIRQTFAYIQMRWQTDPDQEVILTNMMNLAKIRQNFGENVKEMA